MPGIAMLVLRVTLPASTGFPSFAISRTKLFFGWQTNLRLLGLSGYASPRRNASVRVWYRRSWENPISLVSLNCASAGSAILPHWLPPPDCGN